MYLDNNATTVLLPEVQKAVQYALELSPSNASSAHQAGEAARRMLKESREAVASLLSVCSESIVFTSGGTEANNLALCSAISGGHARRLITSAVEHASILEVCSFLEEHGVELVYLPVDRCGRVSPNEIEQALTHDTSLVSIQWVNNETGVMQPIEEIAEVCHSFSVPFHTDAAQAVGKLLLPLGDTSVDMATITAHKWHGPSGIGALYVRNMNGLRPLIHGGQQEHGRRAGTENLLGVVGMGEAAKQRHACLEEAISYMSRARDRFEKLLTDKLDGVSINGVEARRVCNTSNVRFCGIDGQAMVAQLNTRGLICSQGSACESMRPEPSHVLRAMGLNEEEAYSSIRFSFSSLNSLAEIDQAVEVIAEVYQYLRGEQMAQSIDHSLAGDI